MTTKPDAALMGEIDVKPPAAPAPPARPDWRASKLVASVRDRLTQPGTRLISRAPGRLDVMGGIAEYTGALVLNLPTSDHACVALQFVDEPRISIETVAPPEGDSSVEIELGQLAKVSEQTAEKSNTSELVGETSSKAVQCVLGTIIEMLRAGLIAPLDHGIKIAVGYTVDESLDLGLTSAIAAATLMVMAKSAGKQIDPQAAVEVCQRVENSWLRAPVGPADAVCSLFGESHTLTQLRCTPCNVGQPIPLPDELAIVGVDCGTTMPNAPQKYTQVRTASAMGRSLIERIVRHERRSKEAFDGYLSQISVDQYVRRFRDRLPTKLKGKEFRDRFGETDDSLAPIDPSFVYKIRSRTEHHVYENDRAIGFVECLTRAARTGSEQPLVQAGELMYASHWSYGQRCGLGSVETDLLVGSIRRCGGREIYGAKISGRGCGGIVTVLMRASETAYKALEGAIQAYQGESGHRTRLIKGSSSGVMITGVERI
jgi:galactokinase